jgi:hypothetical protein
MNKGHLFIVLGDLRKVSCDAWLVPGDEQLRFCTQHEPPLALYGSVVGVGRFHLY